MIKEIPSNKIQTNSKYVIEILNAVVKVFKEILKKNLIGIYLHGSLAIGGFNPNLSDIDLIIVVKNVLTTLVKRALIKESLKISENPHLPKKGLEYSILLQKELDQFSHPTPFELHYSPYWMETFRKNEFDFEKKRKDRDLAAHLTVTYNRGICLYGKPVKQVFPIIPEKDYLDALFWDIEPITNETNVEKLLNDIMKDIVYFILNRCRVMQYIDEKVISSKEEGCRWALSHLPGEFQTIIQNALEISSGEKKEQNWDKNQILNFIKYIDKNIWEKLSKKDYYQILIEQQKNPPK